jgi:predicted MFS family arabinose efflux permease
MPLARGRLGVIFLTVLVDLIGFGIILPILPYYAQTFGAKGLGFGVLVGAYSAMQFLATAILGRTSDRTGRRPILLATMLLNAVGYVVFALAGSYWVLLVGRLISGFGGGNISVAQAYVADVTSVEERSKGMGVIGAAFGLGFIIGPAVGGLAGHYWGHAAPGFVAAGLSLLNLVLAWRILGESLHERHRVARNVWEFGHLREALADVQLRPLMVVWFLAPFAFAGYSTILPLYASARFGWHEKELGWLFTIVGIVAAIVQGWAFGRLVKVTGDRALVIAGSAGMALAIGVIPFLPSAGALYASTVLLAFSNSVFSPAASGLVSVLANATQQGMILGAAQALSALGRLSGPEVLGTAFDVGGAEKAFLAAGAAMLIGMFVALRIHDHRP